MSDVMPGVTYALPSGSNARLVNGAMLVTSPEPEPKIQAILAYKDGTGVLVWGQREGRDEAGQPITGPDPRFEDWWAQIEDAARQPHCRAHCGPARIGPVE